jgi:hypothetical protein
MVLHYETMGKHETVYLKLVRRETAASSFCRDAGDSSSSTCSTTLSSAVRSATSTATACVSFPGFWR